MWRAESSNTRPGRSAPTPACSGAPMPIATPCCTNMLAIVAMSARSGKLARISESAVNRLAAISGSAAFLAPPILIVPDSGTPPWIRILSIAWLRAAMTAASGDGRSYPRAIPTGDPHRRCSAVLVAFTGEPGGAQGAAQAGGSSPAAGLHLRPPALGSRVRACSLRRRRFSRSARARRSSRAACSVSLARVMRGVSVIAAMEGEARAAVNLRGNLRGNLGAHSLVDAQADLGGENHRDGLPGGVFGGVVAMDAPPRLDPGAIARDRGQTGAARLLERVEHRRSGD